MPLSPSPVFRGPSLCPRPCCQPSLMACHHRCTPGLVPALLPPTSHPRPRSLGTVAPAHPLTPAPAFSHALLVSVCAHHISACTRGCEPASPGQQHGLKVPLLLCEEFIYVGPGRPRRMAPDVVWEWASACGCLCGSQGKPGSTQGPCKGRGCLDSPIVVVASLTVHMAG